MTSKSVYFAQRNPTLGQRFRPRWRRHAALAMSLPPVWGMVARYAQCDPVDDPPAALGITSRYDGVGVTWFRSTGAETVLKDDGQGLFKVFSLLDRRGGGSRAEFARDLVEGFAAELIGRPVLDRGLARLSVCLPDAPQTGRQNDALIEYSFSTLDAATAFFGSDSYLSVTADLQDRAVEVERCATRELMLDDVALYD
jgi:hypothetical protein